MSAARAVAAGLALAFAGPAHASFSDPGYPPTLMLAWATAVDEAVRGPIDIADPGLGDASFGTEGNALGPATNDNFDVYSLGDGGHMTLFFDNAIEDGSGDDFAVYENGFATIAGLFAEFAFVEVSSNGTDFARFPAVSLRTTPVPGGAVVDPHDYDNFAGDQPLNLGTGFDLAELAGHPLVLSGDLDLQNVAYVRVVDVIGDGSTVDSLANPVYDPYATPFDSSGFDLDAIGVIHPVPEPTVAALVGPGAALVGLLARRRVR